ncbi:hypothetical protein [Jiangella mangrovi]|uniref:Uncharacterized protein n=1 Tax=Jiangella mangrovi TaxID=1524084 RepID=A0A7W9GVD4_9ACTN|nr:hypothetical protein [Jiangella mangrovi]MBB5790744.1 hypothetical protein [Jiangella mangrovi]
MRTTAPARLTAAPASPPYATTLAVTGTVRSTVPSSNSQVSSSGR